MKNPICWLVGCKFTEKKQRPGSYVEETAEGTIIWNRYRTIQLEQCPRCARKNPKLNALKCSEKTRVHLACLAEARGVSEEHVLEEALATYSECFEVANEKEQKTILISNTTRSVQLSFK